MTSPASQPWKVLPLARFVWWGLLFLSLACGIVIQSTTVVNEDESSTTALTIAIARELLNDPSVARTWREQVGNTRSYLESLGAEVGDYDDDLYSGLRAILDFSDLATLNARLSGDDLSLFDSFELKRWRGEFVLEAHTTSGLIRERILQFTGLNEIDLLLVQFPLTISLRLPGVPLLSNAGQSAQDGTQTWTINWWQDTDHMLRAVSQVPLIPPVITEPAPGTRIRDASGGLDLAGTGEPGANLSLHRVEASGRTLLATGLVGADRQWRLPEVRLDEPGEYSLIVEETTDHDSAESGQTPFEYRPLEPIVFVPAYYACTEGVLQREVQWRIGPETHWNPTYTGLIPGVYTKFYGRLLGHFANMGYELNKNLFVACYNWSASLPEEAEGFARTLRQAWENNPARIPVTIITHSNGALVSRYYIQNHRAEAARQVTDLIMIAPPNHGVARSYYAWEGGDFFQEDSKVQYLVQTSLVIRCGEELALLPPKYLDPELTIPNPNYAAQLEEYQEKVLQCVRYGTLEDRPPLNLATAPDDQIRSVAWLLPDWEFLQKGDGSSRGYPDAPIRRLNSPDQVARLFEGIQRNVYVLAGEKPNSTARTLRVSDRSSAASPLWENGRPDGVESDTGDDTVLKSSAGLPVPTAFAARYQEILYADATHTDRIIKGAKVLNDITRLIREDFPLTAADVVVSDVLIIWVESPVNLLVTDSAGQRIGVDSAGNLVGEIPDAAYGDTADPLGPKFIVVPDPAEGEIQFQVTGQAEGHYELYGLSSASDEPLIAVSDSITAGEVKTYTAEYSAAPPVPQPASRRWILWALLGVVGLGGAGWMAARRGRRRRSTEYDPWGGSYADLIAEPPRGKPWWKRRKKDDLPDDDW